MAAPCPYALLNGPDATRYEMLTPVANQEKLDESP
jgi:hypothetical protein